MQGALISLVDFHMDSNTIVIHLATDHHFVSVTGHSILTRPARASSTVMHLAVIVQICSICTRARCSDLLDRQLEHCRALGANGNLCGARHNTYRTMAPFVAWSRTRHGSLDLCAIARATASRVCDCAHEGGRSVRD